MDREQAEQYFKDSLPQWETLEEFEKESFIEELLSKVNGNISNAAKQLNEAITKLNKRLS